MTLQYNNNKRNRWDPVFDTPLLCQTAQHGGDVKPSKSIIQEKLSNLTDSYDNDQPEPVPYYFDAESSPTQKVLLSDKGSVPQTVSIITPIQ